MLVDIGSSRMQHKQAIEFHFRFFVTARISVQEGLGKRSRLG